MSELTESLRTHGQQHRGADLGGVLQWAALHIEAQDEALAELRAEHAAEEAERLLLESALHEAGQAIEAVLDDTPIFAESAAHEVTRGVAFGILDAKKATPMAAVKLRSLFGAAWEHAHDCGRRDQPMRE